MRGRSGPSRIHPSTVSSWGTWAASSGATPPSCDRCSRGRDVTPPCFAVEREEPALWPPERARARQESRASLAESRADGEAPATTESPALVEFSGAGESPAAGEPYEAVGFPAAGELP